MAKLNVFGAFRARARPSWFGIHLGFHQQIHTQALYVTIFPRGVTKKMQYRDMGQSCPAVASEDSRERQLPTSPARHSPAAGSLLGTEGGQEFLSPPSMGGGWGTLTWDPHSDPASGLSVTISAPAPVSAG